MSDAPLPTLDSPEAALREDRVQSLRDCLLEAGRLLAAAEQKLVSTRSAANDETEVLRRELAATQGDRDELSRRLVLVEHQASRLMSLYVVTYQLHSTLDPEEVQVAIAEITSDLLGAQSFVLLLREEDQSDCWVALARGLEAVDSVLFAGESYRGGDPAVDTALADGVLCLEPVPGSEAIGVVPLKIRDSVVGALVVLGLFPHRTKPLAADRELLDLLGAHAASALLAARAYTTMVRRVRTLEGLMALLKG